jgi:hypothetical protein
MDVFGKAAMFITEIAAYGTESLKYMLCLRGVFKTYRTREPQQKATPPTEIPAAAGLGGRPRLDDTGKQVLREMLDFVKPHLRA